MIRTAVKLFKTGILFGAAGLAAVQLQKKTRQIREVWSDDTQAKDPKIRYRN